MPLDSTGHHKTRLNRQQHDPSRHNNAVNMHQVRQNRGIEEQLEVIGPSKRPKHQGEEYETATQVKAMVEATSSVHDGVHLLLPDALIPRRPPSNNSLRATKRKYPVNPAIALSLIFASVGFQATALTMT